MAFKILRPATAFSKTPAKQRYRQANTKHLEWIRKLPCAVTGARGTTEAAHVRMASPRHAKPETGMQQRPDDRWVVPLSAKAHRGPGGQHDHDEAQWWAKHGIDPIELACALWSVSSTGGSIEDGELVLREFRKAKR